MSNTEILTKEIPKYKLLNDRNTNYRNTKYIVRDIQITEIQIIDKCRHINYRFTEI